MSDRFYTYKKDLKGKTPAEIRAIIKKYHKDPEQLGCAAFDLINAINKWLKESDRR